MPRQGPRLILCNRTLGLGRAAARPSTIVGVVMEASFDLVKVFSVTRARDREDVGARATAWLMENASIRIVRAVVLQSSDYKFHCYSLVFFCREGAQ